VPPNLSLSRIEGRSIPSSYDPLVYFDEHARWMKTTPKKYIVVWSQDGGVATRMAAAQGDHGIGGSRVRGVSFKR